MVLSGLDATVLPHRRNIGFTGGVNAALRLARGEWIAIVNNDSWLAPDWVLEGLALLAADERAGVLGGREFAWDAENPLGDESNVAYTVTHFAAETGSHTRLGIDVPTKEVFSLDGSNLLARASLMRALGGFDPDFFAYYEDLDLCARARALGFRVYYCREMRIWHRRHLSSDRVPYRRIFLARRNHLMVVAKHFPEGRWLPVVLEECLVSLIHGLFGRQAVLRGRRTARRLDSNDRRACIAASLWGVANLWKLRRKRRKSLASGQHDPRMLERLGNLQRELASSTR